MTAVSQVTPVRGLRVRRPVIAPTNTSYRDAGAFVPGEAPGTITLKEENR
jgi:hypothetical protein